MEPISDSGGRRVPVVVNGPGKVGREFIRLLSEGAAWALGKTGHMPVLCAVTSRRGILLSRDGLSQDQVLGWLSGEGPGASEGTRVLPAEDYSLALGLLPSDGLRIAVEATPTDLVTGEPGLSHVLGALDKGFSVVSLAKGPLVVAFGRLRELARARGVSLKYSGAVAAALPTVDTAVYSMAGAGITAIEGVLNGTTNFILNSMAEGKAYAEALAEAQARGVAEADPRLDVEGYDSAAKLLIIANTVWDLDARLESVKRGGIVDLDRQYVRDCAIKGTPVRLVARAEVDWTDGVRGGRADAARTGDTAGRSAGGAPLGPCLSVGPEAVPAGHPFANLPGTSKAIRFRSKNMGDVTVSGGASDVTGAAAAAFKDLIHILEENKRR